MFPAEDAAGVVSQEQWQAAVNEALGPLAAGEREAALTGLAASCGDILAAHFPPGAPVDPAKQRFHIVLALGEAAPTPRRLILARRVAVGTRANRRRRLRFQPFCTRKG